MSCLQKTVTLSAMIAAALFAHASLCTAEKIYLKNGNVIETAILYRTKYSVWIKQPPGSVGIDLFDIERIENDDGSISKYDYKTLCRRAEYFIQQQQYSEAIDVYNGLVGSFPKDTDIRLLRGNLYQRIGDTARAVDDYNFLIAHGAADAKVFNNLGTIYANAKEYQEAGKMFLKACLEDPAMAEAHNNLAEMYMRTKEYGQAIAEYKKVTALEPKNTKVLYNLGCAYASINDYRNARAQWEKILAGDPQDADAKKAIEYVRAKK